MSFYRNPMDTSAKTCPPGTKNQMPEKESPSGHFQARQCMSQPESGHGCSFWVALASPETSIGHQTICVEIWNFGLSAFSVRSVLLLKAVMNPLQRHAPLQHHFNKFRCAVLAVSRLHAAEDRSNERDHSYDLAAVIKDSTAA